jgi:osmoprotectant transport system substrate-binding protein
MTRRFPDASTERHQMRRIVPSLATATAATLFLTLTGCGSSKKTTQPSSTTPTSANAPAGGATTAAPSNVHVVIGSANFPENEILADIYAGALKAKGVSVTTKLNIGSREVYYGQLQSGALTVFPEYNGALLARLDPSSTVSSTDDVDAALAKALPSQLEILKPSPAQDKDSVTVTQAFAQAHNLKSIADLAPIASTMVMGGPPEDATRRQGIVGLKDVYGLTFKPFKPLDESGPLTIAALRDGTVQAADIFTTDPSVAQYHFVPLDDPKSLFSAQNVIPVINKSVAVPAVVDTLNAVDAALTTDVLVQLVNAVVNQHVDAAATASQFLSQAKLG